MTSPRYLKNKEIDKAKWDKSINGAANGRIYAYSWYLDILAENWDALVVGDYEYIMPLTWKEKYQIPYIYPPYYIQQLGIFSKNDLTEDTYIQFLNVIPFKFRHIHMSLNIKEPFEFKNMAWKVRNNYVLDIGRSYEEIYNGYRHDAKKKLKKRSEEFLFSGYQNCTEILNLYKEFIRPLLPQIKTADLSRLERVIVKAYENGHLVGRILTDDKKTILASGLFLISHARAYYIVGSQTEEGKKKHATHFLLDRFFQEYSGKLRYFDFEGSDVPGIADFFQKWGSQIENYVTIRIRKFPFNLFGNKL